MYNQNLEMYKAGNIHPGFSIDCVILSYHKNKIKVLLNKFQLEGYWALLGGFMFNDENADQAAYRILKVYTGLTNIFLKQFHLFSAPERTILKQNSDFLDQNQVDKKTGEWFLRRFISLGYFALVKYEHIELDKADKNSPKWFDISSLPLLYSDHGYIIKKSIETIQSMLPAIPIGFELLPEKFTISELRKIYEIFLGKELDRRNFQRKVLSEELVVQLDETKNNSSYNPPFLYSFNPNKKNSDIIFHIK